MSNTGLGRGLNALIPNKKITTNTGRSVLKTDDRIHRIPVSDIKPNPHQPRTAFNDDELTDLAASIREHGVLQPIVVYEDNGKHYLISGERRLRASKLAGQEDIPAIVRDVAEQQRLELALIENIQRVNLNPIEEAIAYQKLMDEFGLTQEQAAKKLGKSRSAIANTLRLLNLPTNIQEALVGGKITEGHARALAALEPSKQQAYFQQIIDQKLSVRDTEKVVKEVSVKGHKRVTKVNPALASKAEAWQQHFGTKVDIKGSKNSGQVIIHYYSEDELNNLTDQLT